MGKAIKVFLVSVILFCILLVALLLDLSPAITVDSGKQVDNADSVQPLINELRTSFRRRNQAQQINVNKAQANSLAGFLHRAINQANARADFSDEQLALVISYKVDTGISPLYLNLYAQFDEGEGLTLSSAKIGDLTLPGPIALSIAEYLANKYTNSTVATKAIATVKSIDIDSNNINIHLLPLNKLLNEFKNIQTSGGRKDARVLKIRIAHYLRLLDSTYIPSNASTPANRYSLSYYLHAAMKEAAVLSNQSSATLENEAAILALAIYAGSKRFTTLIGDLSFAIDSIPTAPMKPVLRNRQDLSLHFIFSAAIKLLSQKGISIAVGEFKELMDRGQGGSGYSFVDLAADLSGAHFATLAVNPERAEQLQQIMALGANEDLFMVTITGLEEGLSKQDFENKYTEVDSIAYKRVVTLINERIEKLPVSQP